MVDSLYDDVKDLILKEKGDLKILEQIRRAIENNEVISNTERRYVQNLAEKFLKPKIPREEKKIVPPLVQPVPTSVSLPDDKKTLMKKPSNKQNNSKITKIAIVSGIAVLLIVVVLASGMEGIDMMPESKIQLPKESTSVPSSKLSIKTDLDSYNRGDIISISGNRGGSSGDVVSVHIENPSGDKIWEEKVKVKSNNKFTTLTIADGSGWEEEGDYEVFVDHLTYSESIKIKFNG